jgi:hypothetical protein
MLEGIMTYTTPRAIGIVVLVVLLTGFSPTAAPEALAMGLEAAELEPESPEPPDPPVPGGLGFLLAIAGPFPRIAPSPEASRGTGHGSATASGPR